MTGIEFEWKFMLFFYVHVNVHNTKGPNQQN